MASWRRSRAGPSAGGRTGDPPSASTSPILGFLRVWLLGRCRRLRPISYRARLEHARIDRWLAALERFAARDGALARELAAAAQLVKGYGDVRRKMTALFDDLLETT